MNSTEQVYHPSQAPVGQLKTNRGLLKYILLSIITFGIYGIVLFSSISTDINIIAGRYDGKRTMHYCLLAFLVGWLTAGIGFFVWYHKISARIGGELARHLIQLRCRHILGLGISRDPDRCRPACVLSQAVQSHESAVPALQHIRLTAAAYTAG